MRTSARFALPACVAFLSILLPAWPAAQGLPTGAAEDAGLSSERLQRIKIAMQRYIDRGEVPGVVTLVARRGRVVHFEALGYRDVEAKAPMTKDTIFRIASMTKPITSVAVMMLFEEGHFLLSDPIAKFLPEFASPRVAVPAPAGSASRRRTSWSPQRARSRYDTC